jgi:hypothetical protein
MKNLAMGAGWQPGGFNFHSPRAISEGIFLPEITASRFAYSTVGP